LERIGEILMVERVESRMFGRVRRIHLVGIGGTGMSGIAELLIDLGFEITGSDSKRTDVTERLTSLGAKIDYHHRGDHAGGADVVVVSTAIAPDNPEVHVARDKGVPVIPRAEMLAELMRVKQGIAVAGAHGKTTTTWLTSLVLAEGGLDPTILVGGRLKAIGSGARLGRGDYLVAEADESDGTFLKLSPAIAIVTNVDAEHLDYYGTFEAVKSAFTDFLNKIPFYGACVVNVDDPHVREILPRVTRRVVTYGFSRDAQIRAEAIVRKVTRTRFAVFSGNERLGEVELSVPGLHNVSNALAAIGVGLELGIPFAKIERALGLFSGISRRLEVKGESRGVVVIDDYGHHPAEVRATLDALRQGWPGRIVVIFQPHRYTRTRDLFERFGESFGNADLLFLMEIYPAGEQPIPGVDASLIARAVTDKRGGAVHLLVDKERAVESVIPHLQEGDVVLTLGAGDVWKTGEGILEALAAGATPGGGTQDSKG
jgi:UDP-N-acetylmuramate--alanine ligase